MTTEEQFGSVSVTVEPVLPEEEEEEEDEDDDFGSFDDASIDETRELPLVSSNVFDGDETLISNYINGVLDNILPLDHISTGVVTPRGHSTLLNERSLEILDRLTQPPTYKRIMNEKTWKRSTIRREVLLSLGLPINLDELRDVAKKKNGGSVKDETELELPEFKSLNLSETELSQLLDSTPLYLDKLNIQKLEYYRSIASPEKLEELKGQLEIELAQLKKMYVGWQKYETNLKKDNTIFQDYIENMVGNELKFRNEKMLQLKLKAKKR